MVNNTQTENKGISEEYEQYTDKYFLRSKQILKEKGINPIVRYQVFARRDIDVLKGVDEAVDFIKDVAGEKVKIYVLRDGQKYRAKEPIMKLEGRVQDLIDLETVYLQILSGNLTGEIDFNEIRKNARAVVKSAQDKPVYYAGARHYHYKDDGRIAKICQEEGFAGCSTDIGAKAWNSKGMGTIPHALILSYAAYMDEQGIQGNPTVEAIKGFDDVISKEVPRIILLDTFNREITDAIESAKAVPSLKGVRVDTCGENYAQGVMPMYDEEYGISNDLGEDYFFRGYHNSRGVCIAGVWALRRSLDEAGFKDLEITVSSGFNKDKTQAFMEANAFYRQPIFNGVLTGSLSKPISTTSDICTYFNENKGLWLPMSKVGRSETPSKRLEERG
ncbi:MAG: hypothetical protein ABIB79_03925 [archaeon]